MWIDDLVEVLEDASVGTFGTDIFAGRAPELPHNLVAVIPYGGRGNEETHSGTDRRFPRVQVMARHQQADLALAKAEQVRAAFRNLTQQTINGANYERIVPLTEPIALQRDTVGRYPYVVNYEVWWHAP